MSRQASWVNETYLECPLPPSGEVKFNLSLYDSMFNVTSVNSVPLLMEPKLGRSLRIVSMQPSSHINYDDFVTVQITTTPIAPDFNLSCFYSKRSSPMVRVEEDTYSC